MVYTATLPHEVLVVVHPDSACASADFQYTSPDIAQWRREALAQEISEWEDNIIVMDGEYRDQLRSQEFEELNNAIDDCLHDAALKNLIALRTSATDQDLAATIQRILNRLYLLKRQTIFHITGAWYKNDGSGCVATVTNALTLKGYTAFVAESALR